MVSVILPTYNEREGIAEIVAEVLAVARRAGLEVEVLVVDDAFARLTTLLQGSVRSPLEHAARLADLRLLTEARAAYADAAQALGPERVHLELWRLRARLAATDGDAREASRLSAEADAVLAPARPVGAVMGGQAELVGYDVLPQPLRAGETSRSRPTGGCTGRPGKD